MPHPEWDMDFIQYHYSNAGDSKRPIRGGQYSIVSHRNDYPSSPDVGMAGTGTRPGAQRETAGGNSQLKCHYGQQCLLQGM